MPGAPSLSTALLKPGASLELPVSAGAPEAPEPSLIMQNVMGLRLSERSCLIMALCVPQFLHLEGEVSQSWDTGRVRRGSCDRSVAHGCWFPGILYAESMIWRPQFCVLPSWAAGTGWYPDCLRNLNIFSNTHKPIYSMGDTNPYVSDLFAS